MPGRKQDDRWLRRTLLSQIPNGRNLRRREMEPPGEKTASALGTYTGWNTNASGF
jgi:hypothetical protein